MTWRKPVCEPVATKFKKTNEFISEIRRDGVCPMCDEPLPPRAKVGRARLHCGSTECATLYRQLIDIELRPLKRGAESVMW